MKRARVLVTACLALFVVSLGAGPGAGGATAGAPATSVSPTSEATETSVSAPAATSESAPVPGASDWETIVPGGDCECADGSEFSFSVRAGDPTKVVLFLEGGGACFDAGTCAFTEEDSTTYDWNISPDDDPALQLGIFDFSRTENPFADYTFAYVPYCTGDIHLGDVTREYSPELTVEHNGFTNGTAAVTYLADNYPEAEQVVVVGESAGSIAAPVYSGLVSDLLPDAQITVFADGSGAYADEPTLNAGLSGLWGVFDNMPDWDVNEGLTAEDWGIVRFWVQAGQHDPEIVMARFDYAYDEVQTAFMTLTGSDTSDVGASIDANEVLIEAEGIDQHSYTAPGSNHTLVRKDEFYEMEVNGVRLVDWVAALIAGEPLADVHCEECEAP